MAEPATGLALPLQYAAIGAAALTAGTLLSHLLGVTHEPPGLPDYLLSVVAGAVGGVPRRPDPPQTRQGGLIRVREHPRPEPHGADRPRREARPCAGC